MTEQNGRRRGIVGDAILEVVLVRLPPRRSRGFSPKPRLGLTNGMGWAFEDTPQILVVENLGMYTGALCHDNMNSLLFDLMNLLS